MATMSEPRWRIVQADLRTADLVQLVGSGYHAVLCDPPYGLSPDGRARTWDDLDGADGRGFMGKAWDVAVPGASFWRSVRRCLRPGAHLLAFGGTRTYHRLVCGIEDAGLEVRDMLAWMYGSGFPKSHDVSKAIDAAAGAEREVVGPNPFARLSDGQTFNALGATTHPPLTAPATPDAARWNGYGTALKPAHEPIVLAREPLDGTVAHNALTHGCGGLAIDASRVAGPKPATSRGAGGQNGRYCPIVKPGTVERIEDDGAGRWPANVLFDEAAAEMLDEQSGECKSGARAAGVRTGLGFHGAAGDGGPAIEASTGGASRFFYIAKASRGEREAGCETANHHPTVKPIELATYLARMLLPPPGPEPRRILVPFSGSGSEMIGAVLAGWDEVVGVEMSQEYIAIATARLRHWAKRKAPKKKTTKPQPRRRSMPAQMEMFG